MPLMYSMISGDTRAQVRASNMMSWGKRTECFSEVDLGQTVLILLALMMLQQVTQCLGVFQSSIHPW